MKEHSEDSNLIFPEELERLHFVKIERIVQKETRGFKYHVKNHFNTTVIEAERKWVGQGNNAFLEVDFVGSRTRAGKNKQTESTPLFRATIKKNDNNPIIQNNDASGNLVCVLTSTTGKSLIRIIAVKDKSSLTFHYKVLEMDSENIALFQIDRRQTGAGQFELSITATPLSNPESSCIVARVNFNEGKICLAMAPELDATNKARLIGVTIFTEVVESVEMETTNGEN